MIIGLSLGVGSCGAGQSNAAWLDKNADIYIDKDSVISGTPSAVTGLTAGGKLGIVFTRVGTAGDITMGPNGLSFSNGDYLRFTQTPVNYGKALLVLDFTRDAAPSGTGEIFKVANSPTDDRMWIRHLSTANRALVPVNKTVTYLADKVAIGDRVTIGVMVDYEAKTYEIIDHDGYSDGAFATDAATPILTLDRMDIGFRCNITLHSAAVFFAQTGGAALASDINTVWSKVSGTTVPNITSKVIRLRALHGQSFTLGRSSSSLEREIELANGQDSVKMLTGMKKVGGASVPLHGPGATLIDTAVAATGIAPAKADSNIPPAYMAASALNGHRADYGLPPIRYFFMNVGIAGVGIQALNNNSANGGNGTTIIDNFAYTIKQMKLQAAANEVFTGGTPIADPLTFEIPSWNLFQGVADKSAAKGFWLAEAQIAFNDHKTKVIAETGQSNLRLGVWQSAGDFDTTQTGENYWVKQEQIDLVKNNNGIMIAPSHPIPMSTDNHPTFIGYQTIDETDAWCEAFVDSEIAAGRTGEAWNIVPTASRVGTTVTVDFTLLSGETLVSDDQFYSGVGYANHGFEVTGANITGTVINPTSITINCDATPTEVIFALQSQNVGVGSHIAHRGILRGSITAQPKTHSVGTLYRWVWGFRLAV